MSGQPCLPESSPEKNFRRQLAATVRNIKWSYGIFWALSTTPGEVLVWSDGYYNGDIKTRKTTQPIEFKAEQVGLQRSEQLRELFESLSTGEGVQENKRPSASLCPEDLTDAEWYYLVCMSFTFASGQCLPGKAFANNHHVWLDNAQFADSNYFSRSLLAKSASIQTVICIPFMGGVLELGTTELVSEDLTLIEHVNNAFWEMPDLASSEQSMSSSPVTAEKAIADDHDIALETVIDNTNSTSFPFGELQILRRDSLNGSSEPFQIDEHEDAYQVQNLRDEQLVDDEFDYDMRYPANSNEFISDYFADAILSPPEVLQEGHSAKLMSLDTMTDNSHYAKTLAAILRNSKQVATVTSISENLIESSFRDWRNSLNTRISTSKTNQNMLKRVLVDISWVPGGRTMKSQGKNVIGERVLKSEGDDAGANHVLSERRRREKLNEKFIALRSLLPSVSKVDKASILTDTIEYVKELERRVEELESYRVSADIDASSKRKNTDVAEGTSDNYFNQVAPTSTNHSNKRKASYIDERETDRHAKLSEDVNVTLLDGEVVIKLYSPWRDCLLLEVIEGVSSIQLDAHTVKCSNADGFLSLTLRAKFRSSTMSSPATIKRTLRRILSKC